MLSLLTTYGIVKTSIVVQGGRWKERWLDVSVELTNFGIYVRKLRVDHSEYLKDMALKLGVTPTYLSAVERGKRNAPYRWVDVIVESYNLTSDESDVLTKAISESRYYDRLDISHLTFEDKQLMGKLARGLPEFNLKSKNQLEVLVDSD